MRNIFVPRLFRELSLLERIIHTLVTFGLPISLVNYLFVDRKDLGWLVGIPLALLGGVVMAILFALLEQAFFKLTNRSKSKSIKGFTAIVGRAGVLHLRRLE